MSRRKKYLFMVFGSVGPFVFSIFLKFIDLFFIGGMTGSSGMSSFFYTASNWLMTIGFLVSMISVGVIGIMEAFELDADHNNFSFKELSTMKSLRERLFIHALEEHHNNITKENKK